MGGVRNPGVNLKDYFNNLQHLRFTNIKCNINLVLLGFPVSFPALTSIILPSSEKPQIFSSDPPSDRRCRWVRASASGAVGSIFSRWCWTSIHSRNLTSLTFPWKACRLWNMLVYQDVGDLPFQPWMASWAWFCVLLIRDYFRPFSHCALYNVCKAQKQDGETGGSQTRKALGVSQDCWTACKPSPLPPAPTSFQQRGASYLQGRYLLI